MIWVEATPGFPVWNLQTANQKGADTYTSLSWSALLTKNGDDLKMRQTQIFTHFGVDLRFNKLIKYYYHLHWPAYAYRRILRILIILDGCGYLCFRAAISSQILFRLKRVISIDSHMAYLCINSFIFNDEEKNISQKLNHPSWIDCGNESCNIITVYVCILRNEDWAGSKNARWK